MAAVLLSPTNFFLRSSALTNAAWNKGNSNAADATADVTAPDGTSTASKLTENGAAGVAHTLNQTAIPILNVKDGVVLQWSFYVRGGGTLPNTRRILCLFADSSGSSFVIVNPRTVLIDVVGSSRVRGEIIAAANGWSRATVWLNSVIPGDEGSAANCVFELDNGANGAGASNVYNGDGASGVYLWGPTLATGQQGPVDYFVTGAAALSGSTRGLVR